MYQGKIHLSVYAMPYSQGMRATLPSNVKHCRGYVTSTPISYHIVIHLFQAHQADQIYPHSTDSSKQAYTDINDIMLPSSC